MLATACSIEVAKSELPKAEGAEHIRIVLQFRENQKFSNLWGKF